MWVCKQNKVRVCHTETMFSIRKEIQVSIRVIKVHFSDLTYHITDIVDSVIETHTKNHSDCVSIVCTKIESGSNMDLDGFITLCENS